MHSVINPFDGSEVATTFLAGDDELDQAIKAAENIAEEVQNIPSYRRYNILKQISEELFSLRQQFAELITLESGKPIRYALAEVDRSLQTFIIAAEESKRLQAEYFSIDWTPSGAGKEGFVKYYPITYYLNSLAKFLFIYACFIFNRNFIR